MAVDDLVDEDLVLQFEGRLLGYGYDTVVLFRYEYAAVAAAVQQAVGIGEYGSQRNGTCGLADDAADARDAAAVTVYAAVAQFQLYVGHLFKRLVERAVCLGQVEHLVLVDGEVDIHFRVVRNRGQRL